MKAPLRSKIFRIISQQAALKKVRAFVIGGYVRDYILKRPSTDIDIVVEGNGMEVAAAVASVLNVPVTRFKNFGTARSNTGLGYRIRRGTERILPFRFAQTCRGRRDRGG